MKTGCRLAVALLAAALVMAGSVAHADVKPGAKNFSIYFGTTDKGKKITFGDYTFPVPLWDFGDRVAYRCAWAFLMDSGQAVARVQFDRAQTYTVVQDNNGIDAGNGEDESECFNSFDAEFEEKSKPTGLGDTTVEFKKNGTQVLSSMKFPATSPTDKDSWWEVEEARRDHVEIELYWKQEVAAVAVITSLSPTMTFRTRNSGRPRIDEVSPDSGGVGTPVSIEGVNFVEVSSVTFGGLLGLPALFDEESSHQIIANVPAGALAGLITVTTPMGVAFSPTIFDPLAGFDHASTVSMKLTGASRSMKLTGGAASGSVGVIDGAAQCAAARTVSVQRRVAGEWVGSATATTSATGSYSTKLSQGGTYRAKVMETTLPTGDLCLSDVSKARVL